jgi:RNA-directed DNA polymerase
LITQTGTGTTTHALLDRSIPRWCPATITKRRGRHGVGSVSRCGFRPGRGCQDAIEAIYWTLNGPRAKRLWILDADLSAAFDRIDHDHLRSALGGFPAWSLIAGWLRAGVMELGQFAPTDEGTPQGGVVSPLLLNIALHAMEQAAGVSYRSLGTDGAQTVAGTPALVRYADDFVVMCHTRDQAEQAWRRLGEWLAPRGLAINEDKTRIVHLSEGFDFLGFNVRRYGGKLLIKPSKAAVRRIRKRLTAELRALRGSNAAAVISTRNPIIRGWAAYYRGVVSKEVFAMVDHHLWQDTYRWALRSHPNKAKRGSPPATSACSTRPGRIGGCSATATAAPTSADSSGPRSSVISSSGVTRRSTTQP